MAKVRLDVFVELSDEMKGGWFVIDRTNVDIDNGHGEVMAERTVEHSYHCWFEGAPGGTFEYEIKQGDQSIVKSKSVVQPNRYYGRGSGDFTLV